MYETIRNHAQSGATLMDMNEFRRMMTTDLSIQCWKGTQNNLKR